MKFVTREDLKSVGCGVLMGAADIVPGVSGGTVALVLGIYARLLAAISHVDSTAIGHVRGGRWADAARHIDLRFLISLGFGIGSGIAGLAYVMHYLLTNQLQLTYAVFFGLILGSGILVGRTVREWRAGTVVMLLAGTAAAWVIVAAPALQDPPDSYLYLWLCGVIGICAMILPGISGSFILLILGRYETVTGLIRSLLKGDWSVENIVSVIVFAAGCLGGLLMFSRLLRWLLSRYHDLTMSILCGFMVGSLRRIWPFKGDVPPDSTELVNAWPDDFAGLTAATFGLMIVSLIAVLALESVSRRLSHHDHPA